METNAKDSVPPIYVAYKSKALKVPVIKSHGKKEESESREKTLLLNMGRSSYLRAEKKTATTYEKLLFV